MLTLAVSRCHTRGESEDHIGEKTGKQGSPLASKSSADVTRSPKQGYQVKIRLNKKDMTELFEIDMKILFLLLGNFLFFKN